MDFTLTEEHKLIQQTAYKFAIKELEPLAKECDREEKGGPEELLKKAVEAGLVGSFIPEEYGGPGFGQMGEALVAEQISRIDMGLGMDAVTARTFGSQNLVFWGNEEQKRKYLPPLVRGEIQSAGAYTEPDAGTDLTAARTKAVRDGDEYVINGSKMFITNGNRCDFMITFCMTHSEEEKKQNRHSLILIESDREGVTRRKIRGKMGIRASDTAEITFDNVRVPCSNLIGEEKKGFYQLMHFFNSTRTLIAAMAVGLAQGALDKTITYIKERKVFGRPLASFQDVQFQVAEMAVRIEVARNTMYKAALSVDQNEIDPVVNTIAKYFAAEVVVWVCDKALQLHGGYGYIDEFDVQRFYRDAKAMQILEGAKAAEKMAISRRLLF
jgi:alkylation response protein AidB-like acyl-CoA dehydrogenase